MSSKTKNSSPDEGHSEQDQGESARSCLGKRVSWEARRKYLNEKYADELEAARSMSPEELRRLRRRISNRESARRLRKQRSEKLGELQEQQGSLEDKFSALSDQILTASLRLQQLEAENAALQAQLGDKTPLMVTSVSNSALLDPVAAVASPAPASTPVTSMDKQCQPGVPSNVPPLDSTNRKRSADSAGIHINPSAITNGADRPETLLLQHTIPGSLTHAPEQGSVNLDISQPTSMTPAIPAVKTEGLQHVPGTPGFQLQSTTTSDTPPPQQIPMFSGMSFPAASDIAAAIQLSLRERGSQYSPTMPLTTASAPSVTALQQPAAMLGRCSAGQSVPDLGFDRHQLPIAPVNYKADVSNA